MLLELYYFQCEESQLKATDWQQEGVWEARAVTLTIFLLCICHPFSQLLVLEVGATPLHICLPPTSPSAHLLTACEDGLHCFNTQLGTSNTSKRYRPSFCIFDLRCWECVGMKENVTVCFLLLLSRSKEMEITFPIYKKEDKEHDYHTIDGLSFLTDDIVGKWWCTTYKIWMLVLFHANC